MPESAMEKVREFCELNSRFVEEVSDHPTARHDLVGAVERGELPNTARFLERLHPDCQWFVTEEPRQAHRGKEAFLRMVESWLEVTTDWRAVPGEVTEGENAFVIEMAVTGRGRARRHSGWPGWMFLTHAIAAASPFGRRPRATGRPTFSEFHNIIKS